MSVVLGECQEERSQRLRRGVVRNISFQAGFCNRTIFSLLEPERETTVMSVTLSISIGPTRAITRRHPVDRASIVRGNSMIVIGLP